MICICNHLTAHKDCPVHGDNPINGLKEGKQYSTSLMKSLNPSSSYKLDKLGIHDVRQFYERCCHADTMQNLRKHLNISEDEMFNAIEDAENILGITGNCNDNLELLKEILPVRSYVAGALSASDPAAVEATTQTFMTNEYLNLRLKYQQMVSLLLAVRETIGLNKNLKLKDYQLKNLYSEINNLLHSFGEIE